MSGTPSLSLFKKFRPILWANKCVMESLLPNGKKNFRGMSQSVFKQLRLHQRNKKTTRCLSTTMTRKANEEQNIHKSLFPDMDIPNIPLTDYLFPLYDQYGTKEALVDAATGKSYTFLELKDTIIRVASGLTKLGYKKGDVLALSSTNCPEFNVVITATAMLGIVLTTSSPAYTPDEIARHLQHSGAKGIVTLPALVPGIQQAINSDPGLVLNIKDKIVIGEALGWRPFSTLVEDDGKSVPNNVDINAKEDLIVLPYSSGTTGLPKGVMLTHHNIVSNIIQIQYHIKTEINDNALGVLPFFHIYGMVPVMFGCLRKGSRLVTIPRFDPELFLTSMQKYKISHLQIVPPIALFMAKHPMVSKFDMSSLCHVISGAAPLGEAATKLFMDRFKVPLCQGYGLTETSPVTHCDLDPPHMGSIGSLVPNTLGKIVDLDTNKALGFNETGELCVHGPQVMKGYLNNQEATDSMLKKDGWLHTGDIGYVQEDGVFVICDRLKELIKYKGFQVPPAELENLLLQHPGIQDAAVVGVPDVEAGELPKAYVVCKPDVKLTIQDVTGYIEKNAAPYKKLRGGVEFIEEIPKAPNGKILRRVLKENITKSS